MTADTPLPYDDIVWACTNLCELLEVENDALAQHDSQTVKDLADNKAALARIYEQSVLPMAEDPTLVETLEPEQKEELLALGERLKDLVERNARRLKANMAATNMVMESMVNAAKDNAVDTTTYSATGTYVSKRGSEANSLAFNNKL